MTLTKLTYNFEVGRASRDCGFHKFWGCKFLGLCCKVRTKVFTKYFNNI